MKKLLIALSFFACFLFVSQKAEAKIWTKDLVDKVTLDSGYKFSLCTIDMKYDRRNQADNVLSAQEKDFETNPNSYPCNKNSQEDILFANVTLNFSKTNWNGGIGHEKIIEFQNKIYSVNSYSDMFNPDFVDSKHTYADLAGVDWFSTTPGLRGIRGGNLANAEPSAKGAFLPNSNFIIIHNPATGNFTSALFVFNNVVYKLANVISQVTVSADIVDYSKPVVSVSPSAAPSVNVQPSIIGISPASGGSSDEITIYGKNLVSTIPSGITIEFLRNGVRSGAIYSSISEQSDGSALKFRISGLLAENIDHGTYQIRAVNDRGNSNTVDFTLTTPPAKSGSPSINVTYPFEGGTLQKGSDTFVNLTFSPTVPNGGFVVNLLSADSDTAVAHLKYCGTTGYIQDSAEAPNVSWSWKVGFNADGKEIPSGNYRIMAFDCGSKVDAIWSGTSVFGKSKIFSIVGSASAQPSITVTSPNGGEKLTQGQTYQVTWRRANINDEVAINLLDYTPGPRYGMQYGITNGTTIRTIAGQTSFSWTIPTYIPAGDYYKVTVGSRSVNGFSDNYFSIAAVKTSPEPSIHISGSSGNQTNASALTVNIGDTFTISGVPQNLQGLKWISNGVPGGGVYGRTFYFDQTFANNNSCGNNEASTSGPWTMTCTAKVAGSSDFYIEIYSNLSAYRSNTVSVTILQPTITVLSPTDQQPGGAEDWVTGKTYDIRWRAQGFETAVIEVIDYSYSSEIVAILASGVYALKGSNYSWTIPADFFTQHPNWKSGDNFKIFVAQIKSDGTYGAQALSSGYFRIVSPTNANTPSITSISPASGTPGDTITISGKNLKSTVPSGIKIEFLKNGLGGGSISKPISEQSDGLVLSFKPGIWGANADAGTYKLRVTNDNGTSNTVDFTLTQ